MEFIVFKKGKKSFNVRLCDECRDEMVNTIKYCMEYLRLSNGKISLRALKRFLKNEVEICNDVDLEKSLVIDLENLEKQNNIKSEFIDADMVEEFNKVISEKRYLEILEMIAMFFIMVVMELSEKFIDFKMQKIIGVSLLILTIALLLKSLSRMSELVEDFKKLGLFFKRNKVKSEERTS